MRISFVFAIALLVGGCARHEFDLVQPPDLATHIGKDKESVVKRDELEYQMQAVESRLLMWGVNSTDDAIELIGPGSTAGDSAGECHPFCGRGVGPANLLKV